MYCFSSTLKVWQGPLSCWNVEFWPDCLQMQFSTCTVYVVVQTEKKARYLSLQLCRTHSLVAQKDHHHHPGPPGSFHDFMCSSVFEGASEYYKTRGLRDKVLSDSTHLHIQFLNSSTTPECVHQLHIAYSTLLRFQTTAGGLRGVSETKGRLPSLCIYCLIY